MSDVRTSQLLRVLKRALKNHGVRYRDLASRIGMSESGVKKLLTGDDLSFERLAAICDALGVSVADVVAEAARPHREVYRPTSSQRAAYVAEPRLLPLLWTLQEERGALEPTRARLGLDRSTMRRLVKRLARIEMVEIEDAARARVLHPGITDWRLPADVGRAVMAPMQDALLERARAKVESGEGERVELGLGRLLLHPRSVDDLKRGMRELLADFSRRARRERALHPAHELEEVGAMTVLAPFGLSEALDSLS